MGNVTCLRIWIRISVYQQQVELKIKPDIHSDLPHYSLLSPIQSEYQLPFIITITFYFSYCREILSYIHVSIKNKCHQGRQKGLYIMIYFLGTTEEYLSFNVQAECISIKFIAAYI